MFLLLLIQRIIHRKNTIKVSKIKFLGGDKSVTKMLKVIFFVILSTKKVTKHR